MPTHMNQKCPIAHHGWPTQIDDYKRIETIGSGAYGTVYKIQHKGHYYAMKLGPDNRCFHNETQSLTHLQQFNLPIVPKLYTHFTENVQKAIILDLVDGMDLITQLIVAPPSLSVRIEICRQLIKTVDQLHQLGVSHCDIKPDNVMISWTKQDTTDNDKSVSLMKLVLVDYSYTYIHKTTEDVIVNGTTNYMSPDLIYRRYHKPKTPIENVCRWTINNDIWATAISCYSILTLSSPLRVDDKDRLIRINSLTTNIIANRIARVLNSKINSLFHQFGNFDWLLEILNNKTVDSSDDSDGSSDD